MANENHCDPRKNWVCSLGVVVVGGGVCPAVHAVCKFGTLMPTFAFRSRAQHNSHRLPCAAAFSAGPAILKVARSRAEHSPKTLPFTCSHITAIVYTKAVFAVPRRPYQHLHPSVLSRLLPRLQPLPYLDRIPTSPSVRPLLPACEARKWIPLLVCSVTLDCCCFPQDLPKIFTGRSRLALFDDSACVIRGRSKDGSK